MEYTFQNVNDSTCLIEEYLDGGIEYSVESLTYRGTSYIIQITENIFPLVLFPRQHADMPCLLTRSAVFFSPPSERCWGPFCLC